MYYVLRARKGVPGIGRKIARALNAQEVTVNHRPKPAIQDQSVIINYGRSQVPVWWREDELPRVAFLNHPNYVANAVNKLNTLRILTDNGVDTLEFTTDHRSAEEWLREGHIVFARETTTGKKGQGIHIINPGDQVPHGLPLYTKRFPKTHEFRIHVAYHEIIDYRQKKKRSAESLRKWGLEREDRHIRSRGRGWTFSKNNILRTHVLEDLAISATEALDLDFAGVDVMAIIKHGQLRRAVVCEVNSAPGMSDPRTLSAYVDYFKSFEV
jgi:glutathione synthase/RimK-type ligase-like ATP-grasp enzyme